MSNQEYQLELSQCQQRQQRLKQALQSRQIDFALLKSPANVQYFTGFRPHPLLQALLLISAEGKSVLVAPNEIPEYCTADEVVPFPAQWLCTLRQDQTTAAGLALAQTLAQPLKHAALLPRSGQTIGLEDSAMNFGLPAVLSENSWKLVNLEPELWKLRRCKDSDELAMIRQAIAGTHRMYEKAREIIEPGITELEVYNQLQAAVTHFFGEPATASGNDFQCNSPGGPPRPRPAEAGELFILDLGPAYRGYYADNCRTFAVNQRPTDEQLQAWQTITEVFTWLEETVRPGVSAKAVFQQARERLAQNSQGTFPHHLGHGIGLYPHETPHLNEHWDDHFAAGDVFAAEPALYAPTLKAGIRLEQNYLVTSTGVERLTNFSLDL